MEKKQNRKEYFKNYYLKHQTELLAKLCARVTCQFCGTVICNVNIYKHQKTKLCAKLQEQRVRLTQDITYYNNKTYGNTIAYNEDERKEFKISVEQYIKYLEEEEKKENTL
jgi:hypothetical protein